MLTLYFIELTQSKPLAPDVSDSPIRLYSRGSVGDTANDLSGIDGTFRVSVRIQAADAVFAERLGQPLQEVPSGNTVLDRDERRVAVGKFIDSYRGCREILRFRGKKYDVMGAKFRII